MSLGRGFLSLLPTRPSPENLALHDVKLIPLLYFTVHGDLFLPAWWSNPCLSLECLLIFTIVSAQEHWFFLPCYYFSTCKSVLLWESVWNTSSCSPLSCFSLQLNFHVWIPWHCLQPWSGISDPSSTRAFLWHFDSRRHGPNVPEKPHDPWAQGSLLGDRSPCFRGKSWTFGGGAEGNFKISVIFHRSNKHFCSAKIWTTHFAMSFPFL